jgi:putative redox protein
MKPPVNLRITWAGGKRFDAGRPGGPTARMDASGETGPSPFETMIDALAGCGAIDVVEVLQKRRTPAESLTVDAHAVRADAVPARLVSVRLDYQITGAGIDRENAERAIQLAITKYCSVRDSLDPAIPIEFSLALNGETGAVKKAAA